jgi:hypothetical protein
VLPPPGEGAPPGRCEAGPLALLLPLHGRGRPEHDTSTDGATFPGRLHAKDQSPWGTEFAGGGRAGATAAPAGRWGFAPSTG